MSKIAFTTIHGSRLYGLSHASSDNDSMIVYTDNRTAYHKKSGDDDVIHVGMNFLIQQAQEGSHQFLEGLLSQQKKWEDESFKALIESYRIPAHTVSAKYERTIKRLCFDTFKYRRHAVRLYCNLADLRETGTFNPTLSEEDIEFTGYMATLYKNWDLAEFLLPHLKIS